MEKDLGEDLVQDSDSEKEMEGDLERDSEGGRVPVQERVLAGVLTLA